MKMLTFSMYEEIKDFLYPRNAMHFFGFKFGGNSNK
tara:strand:- start:4592 stop:4699 length:108 start_codon:yes stop_codon:yes gene_type:complete